MIERKCRFCTISYRGSDPGSVDRLLNRHERSHGSATLLAVATDGRTERGIVSRPLAFLISLVGLAGWGFTHASARPDGAWLLAVLVAAIGVMVLRKYLRHHSAKLERLAAQDVKRTRRALPAPPEASCIEHASCEPNDHTHSWPCVWAPGTGHRWLEFREGIRQ